MARTMGVLRTLPGNRERSPDLALLEGSARWRLGPGLLPSFPCERGRDAGRGGDFGGRGVGAQRETVRRGRGIAAVRDRGDSGNRLIIAVRGVEVVLACSSDCAWAWQRLAEEGRGAAERRAGLCLSSCWGPSTTIFLLINKRRRSRPCRVRPIYLIIYLL